MKRYLVFFGDCYYPQGGWDDLKASYDTVEEAIQSHPVRMSCGSEQWMQVVDWQSGEVVHQHVYGKKPSPNARERIVADAH